MQAFEQKWEDDEVRLFCSAMPSPELACVSALLRDAVSETDVGPNATRTTSRTKWSRYSPLSRVCVLQSKSGADASHRARSS